MTFVAMPDGLGDAPALRSFAPAPLPPSARTTMSRLIRERAIARTAAALLCRLDEMTEQLVARITNGIEFYRVGDVVSQVELRRSVPQTIG